MVLNSILSVAILIATLVLGILLRRLLVHRLHKSLLDNWLVQTLGFLLLLMPLLIGGGIALALWNTNLFLTLLQGTTMNQVKDLASHAGQTIGTLLCIVFGIGIARTLQKRTLHGLGSNRLDINIRTLIGRVFYFMTLLVTAFTVLTIWGVQFGMPVAVAGAVTVALTVAIQDILKDLVAGFYILVERPFYIGNQISVYTTPTVNYTGKVEDIQLRATKLRSVSGEEIAIPNAIIFNNAVVNNTYYGERRAAIAVSLPHTAYSQAETAGQIIQALQEIEQVMRKPEPSVVVSEMNKEMVTLLVRFWVASSQVIDVSAVMYTLHALLPEADLAVREPLGYA